MATEKQQFYSDTLLQAVRKHRFLPEKPSNLTRNNQALSQ